MRIAILLAVHNRWDMTRNVLLKSLNAPDNLKVCVHVVDDGSTDSTFNELSKFDNVSSIRGDGDLFWAKSMKLAQDSVFDQVDYFLWLNNDVDIVEEFYSRISEAISAFPSAILVGQTHDPSSSSLTYGGMKRVGRHPHRLRHVEALEDFESVDTFCGNIVLIPFKVCKALGGIDGEYEHGFADYDFGYRARKAGYEIKVIPGSLGFCHPNRPLNPETRAKLLSLLVSKKYLPIKSQIRFCKKHGGPEWPIYLLAPYLRAILKIKKYRPNQTSSGF